MRKLLKIMGYIFLAIIVLMFVTTLLLTKVIDPNNYKTQIEQLAFDKTHRHVVISGPISWSFFPWLGLHISQVKISNTAEFTGDLADIGELQLRVRALPLLTGKVEVKELDLNNITVNFSESAQGESNFHGYKKLYSVSNAANYQSILHINLIPLRALNIHDLQINNANIRIQQAKKTWNFNAINLRMSEFDFNKNFPLQLSFNVKQDNSPNVIKTTITTLARLNPMTLEMVLPELTINSTLVRPKLPPMAVKLTGKVIYDNTNQSIQLNQGEIDLANLKMFTTLSINKIFKKPTIQLDIKSNDAQMQALLRNVWNKDFIHGKFNFTANLRDKGENLQQLLENLQGTGQFNLQNGAVEGTNIEYFLDQALSFLANKPAPAKPAGPSQTPFTSLAGSFTINRGVLQNKDLKLVSNHILVNGNGRIDLSNQSIHSELEAQYQNANSSDHNSFALPLIVTGTCSDPVIQPNFDAIARKVISTQLQPYLEKVKKKIGIEIKSLLH